MIDEPRKVQEVIDYLNSRTHNSNIGGMDILKVFLIRLISKYLSEYDYYSVLGFLDDLKNEWTRLNVDLVNEKEIEDNGQN